jgi:hypothetical protein
MFYEVKRFVDEKGRMVEHHDPQEDALGYVNTSKTKYIGFGLIQVVLDNNKVVPQQFNFEILADDIKTAFEKYDQAAKDEIENIKAKMLKNQKRIITTDSMPSSNILKGDFNKK